MTSKFLPTDYKSPSANNNYMKLQEGENKLRILSNAVIGWEEWLDNKPIRYTFDKKPNKIFDSKKPIRHFWSFIVWNYQEEAIQILNITQATIRNCIESLCKDSDWGEPFNYDLKIIKKGDGMETEYLVNPLPHKPLNTSIIKAFEEKPCNLEALFDNLDPFADHASYTPGFFQTTSTNNKYPSEEQAKELEKILNQCSASYKKSVENFIERQNFGTLADLPMETYEKIKSKALEERDLFQQTLKIEGENE